MTVQDWVPAESAGEKERRRLREENGVELVSDAADGAGIHSQAPGVYGFTYSVGTADAPVFRKSASRTFELHKRRADGEVCLIGCTTAEAAAKIQNGEAAEIIEVYPAPEGKHSTFVSVPMSRVSQSKQHSTRETGAARFRLYAS